MNIAISFQPIIFRHDAASWGHGASHETENNLQITKNSIKTNAGPRGWFTGAAAEGWDYMALRGPAGVLHDIVVDPA